MLKAEESVAWTRPCDTCPSAACSVCQSCESSPAAFFCRADAASLCAACDAQIHSANPLARRHQRVPILPVSADSCSSVATDADNGTVVGEEDEDDREVASWLMLNPGKHTNNNGFLFGVEYLDLVDYSSSVDNQFEGQYQRSFWGEDGVVPLQVEESTSRQHNFHLGINHGCSTGAHYSYNDSLQDLNHTVSVSAMDISVVPESTASDTTVQHPRTPKETVDQLCGPPTQTVQQLTPADREARVMRYREKKKMRKFDKTIRYASRKAYAEIRPRIKGRFAKRTETELAEADAKQLFSTKLTSDTGYGIVPSL